MSINLNRVQVEGLFNTYKLDVPIEGNTLILVGENGSGKSTLINLIYYALTAQWDRLSELPFQSCTITIDHREYRLDKAQLPSNQKRSGALDYLERRMPKDELSSLLAILRTKFEQILRLKPLFCRGQDLFFQVRGSNTPDIF